MTTATKTRTDTVVPPFGIEIDAPRNNDIVIQCIPGCRLRSVIKARAGVKMMPMMPETPGMQIHVNPAAMTYTIIDPMHKDTDLCDAVQAVLEQADQLSSGKTLRGAPPQSDELDADRMKSLCREMLHLLKSGYATMKKGPEPSMEDVNDLPGDFLLNPGSRIHNSQPRLEKDMDRWQRQMSSVGG